MRVTQLWLALSLFLPLWSCKTTANRSQPKHDFGKLSQARISFACTQWPIAKSFEELHAYTQAHVTRLLESSRAELPEAIDASKFCYAYSEVINGGASANATGTLSVGLDLVRWVDNDAEYAYIIAHELAHFLNSHGLPGTLPPELEQDAAFLKIRDEGDATRQKYFELADTMKKFPEYRSLDDNLARYEWALLQYARLSFAADETLTSPAIAQAIASHQPDPRYEAAINAFKVFDSPPNAEAALAIAMAYRSRYLEKADAPKKSRFALFEPAFLDERCALGKQLVLGQRREDYALKVLGPERKANWQEQLADEIGLELYARAGYAPEQASGFFENLLAAEKKGGAGPQSASERQGIADELESCKRGSEAHPATCWRIQNLASELQRHKADFARIVSRTPAVNVFGDQLIKLQEKLRPRP